MSAHRRKIVYSPEASADFDDLLLYGELHWGEDHTARYGRDLEVALGRLSDHPFRAPARDDIFPDCRLLVFESHVIGYRVERVEIWISRILSQRMDLKSQFWPQ